MARVTMETVIEQKVGVMDYLSLWAWFQGSFPEFMDRPILIHANGDRCLNIVNIERLQDWSGEIDSDFIRERMDEVLGKDGCIIHWPPCEEYNQVVLTSYNSGDGHFVLVPSPETSLTEGEEPIVSHLSLIEYFKHNSI